LTLPTCGGDNETGRTITVLYLDNAATSWPKPEEVYRTHDTVLRSGGNAGRGVNQASLAAGRQLIHTREKLAQLFKIKKSERIIFTQNVTEALNTGLRGLLSPGDHVLISALEHNSVVRPLESLKSCGVAYTVAPCTREGVLDVDGLEQYLRKQTKLLMFTHASNVLGTILPLKEIGEFARRRHLLLGVDAAQTAGTIPLDVEDMKIDFLAFTGHKSLFGPPGTGGFYLREGLKLAPLLYGGTGTNSASLDQPSVWPEGMESGTRNVPGIAALGAGIDFILNEGLEKIRRHEVGLIIRLQELLATLPQVEILGPREAELRTGLLSCTFGGISPDYVSAQLDRKYGIITRSGLHCAPLAHQTAGTLKQGALRISPGVFNTSADMEVLYLALKEILAGER
jgi:cysteine desulfurase family protein